MPVDPLNPYTDLAHPSTRIGDDYRYGCWSVDKGPRGTTTVILVPWFRVNVCGVLQQKSKEIETDWKPINCGHDPEARATDRACRGCENATEQAEEVKQQDEIQSVQQSSKVP